MERVPYLVVGGGYAGASAVMALRRLGAEGEILLVSAEPHPPYYRYALSKDYLQGKRPRERLWLRPPSWYEERGVRLRLGVRAVGLDPERRLLTLEDGTAVAFDRLFLATGAEPRRLPLPGSDLPGVLTLRDLEDADALKARARPGARAVFVGGGFIGAEAALSLAALGVECTVLDRVPVLWSHLFGEEVGRFFHAALEARGVRVHTPVRIACIRPEGDGLAVETEEGERFAGDFVVMGVGVRPRTELAEAAGLPVDGGILVNERLETPAPGIYAGGDCARFLHPLYREHLRVEHWDIARGHGETAARNMLGDAQPYEEVPYFFSHLGDLWVEFLGHAPAWDRLAFRRFGAERFAAFYLREGRVEAVLLVNDTEELPAARALVQARAPVGDPARLEDPSRPLDGPAPP